MRKSTFATIIIFVIILIVEISTVGFSFSSEEKSKKVSVLKNQITQLRKQGYTVDDLILIDKNVSGFIIKDFEKNAISFLNGNCPDIISCGAITEEIKCMGIKKGETVIDIGTGQSNYLLKISDTVGEKGKIITTDINPNAKLYGEWKIKTIITSGLYAKQLKNSKVGKNITFKTNSINNLLMDKEIADRILLIQVHLYNKDGPEYENITFTRSIIYSLKKDGEIILLDYYKKSHKNLPPEIAIKKIARIYSKFNCKITRTFFLTPKGDWDKIYGVVIKKI